MKAGWEIKKLGDVLHIERGGSPRPINKYLTDSSDGINWIKISDATASDKYIYATKEKIKKDGLVKTRMVFDGDFLLSNSMSFGRPYIMKTTGCIHDGWLVLKNKKSKIFESDFLYYLLSSPYVFNQFDSLAAGSTVRNLNIALVSSVSVPVPPIQEQRRIVAILDEAFAGIAAAKEKAEQNLKNAKEVFESHLQVVFAWRSKDWKKTTLEKVLDIQPQNGWSPPSANHADYGTPVLTLSSVTGFIFKPDKIKFTSADIDLSQRYWVKNGDFLMTRSNTPELVGHVSIASGIEKPTIYPDLIMRMVPNKDCMVNEFLYYQMRSPVLRSEITEKAHGANPTMKKISNKSVKALPIFAPSVKIQEKIVEEVKTLSAETSRLESLYQQKLSNLEELKKSLLQQAFSGAL